MHHDRWFLENISERRLCSCTGFEIGMLVAGLAGAASSTAHTIYQATNKDDSDIPDMPAPPESAPEAEKEAYKSAQLARKRRQTQQRKVAGVEGREGTILTGNRLGGATPSMQPNEIGGMNASGKSYGSAPAPKTLLGG